MFFLCFRSNKQVVGTGVRRHDGNLYRMNQRKDWQLNRLRWNQAWSKWIHKTSWRYAAFSSFLSKNTWQYKTKCNDSNPSCWYVVEFTIVLPFDKHFSNTLFFLFTHNRLFYLILSFHEGGSCWFDDWTVFIRGPQVHWSVVTNSLFI